MKYFEKTIFIKGDDFQMLGIASLPDLKEHRKNTAVLIITGGFQYRIGSHRQFTRMSRLVASAGYPAMRFDMPGLGDSPGEMVPFDQTAPHIAAAMETLVQATGTQKVILWGLCDGASAALIYMQKTRDSRVSGIVLLNPWIHSETSSARTYIKHYYLGRIFEISFWYKLLQGGIGLKALHGFFISLRKMMKPLHSEPASFQETMAHGWSLHEVSILLLLSENDLTAQEFKEYTEKDLIWKETIRKKPAVQHILKKADHTCSQLEFHKQMVQHTLEFLNFIDSKNVKF
jgi:exosortase A-associated hydrolase 1